MKVIAFLSVLLSSQAFAAQQCSNQTVGGTAVLNAQGCGFSTPWACYEKLVTTCTDDNGVISQFEQTVFVGCVQSFNQCRN